MRLKSGASGPCATLDTYRGAVPLRVGCWSSFSAMSAFLAVCRASPEDSVGPEVRKMILPPKRIVVRGQGEEPFSIGIVNPPHRLLAFRANENCARLAFVDLLFGIAGGP